MIQQQRQCYCLGGGRIVLIVVRSDTIFSITALDTLPNSLQTDPYLTIDQLFDFIETSYTIPSALVEVSYNEPIGFPERIFIDRLPNAVDDEITYLTSAFVPIRQSSSSRNISTRLSD